MKTLFTILFLLIAAMYSCFAQSKLYDFTFYVGISPQQTPVQAGLIVNRENPLMEYVFNLDKVEKQYTFGFRKNIRFSRPFFGTLGLEYCRQRHNYSMNFTHEESPGENGYQLTTTDHVIALPVGVGVKLNNVDITSGLRVQYGINSKMEEERPMGIEMDKARLEMGWYSGIGITTGQTRIGVQYQASFQRIGHNLVQDHKPMELMNVPGNFSFTLGFSF